MKTIYSMVIDAAPRFGYQGYHLAMSLRQHCTASPADIHVHLTPEVGAHVGEILGSIGCTLHQLEPFGDRKYCNKVAQLQTLLQLEFDRVVLLDTDMIAVTDMRPLLEDSRLEGVLAAKTVDLSLPRPETLRAVASLSGLARLPGMVTTDAREKQGWFMLKTYAGNCNGGFYSMPRAIAEKVNPAWRKRALWLLENDQILREARVPQHVDQVSMWLVIHQDQIPFAPCLSNLNYFTHMRGKWHQYYDRKKPIALLHYHNGCDTADGLLAAASPLDGPIVAAAVEQANTQIRAAANARLFDDMQVARIAGQKKVGA